MLMISSYRINKVAMRNKKMTVDERIKATATYYLFYSKSFNYERLTMINFSMIKNPIKNKNNDFTGVYFVYHNESKKNHSPTNDKILNQWIFQDDQELDSTKNTLLFKNAEHPNYRHILIVGLGRKSTCDKDVFRQAGAKAYQELKSHKLWKPFFHLPSPSDTNVDETIMLSGLTEGLYMASYNFKHYQKTDPKLKFSTFQFVTSPNTERKKALQRAKIIGEQVNFAKWLGDMPGNLMTPKILAETTLKLSRGLSGLKVNIWNPKRIQKEKMNSFLSVAKGSSEEPRMIMLEYKGAPQSKKTICFVGKALTFDSGGISLKPSAGMEEMKYDMCGAANVIGAIFAIAKLGLKINVIGLIGAAENLPGPNANKPGDIVTARNGKTIEVNNTDAEGRLVLADLLVYASEKKPQFIVDAATLTGAIVIALGNCHTGFFTRNKDFSHKIEKAATDAGELVWPMPLIDFHSDDMKGTFGDLSNLAPTRGAGSSTAAAFLENFVAQNIPWAHFDIAGTAWNAGERATYNPKKGATGCMVRTFINLAENF